MYDLETTSADEMMIGVAQRLSQINNVLMLVCAYEWASDEEILIYV